MPVSDCHPSYHKYRVQWERIQDVMDGEDAVRKRGALYLPKIHSQQEDADYLAYSNRATFFNATKRTGEAMTGFIFRKPPTIVTKMDEAFTEDVDMRGATMEGYCRKVTTAASSKGRGGTLIDWNEAEARPFLSFYAAEDIINWRVSRIAGRMALTLLVLREWETKLDGDGFAVESNEIWIVFRLTERGETAECTMEKWRASAPQDPRGEKKSQPDPGATKFEGPTSVDRTGTPLDEIPFVFHNSDEPGAEVSVPPLNDIATVNVHHFQASAELANARHVCAVPTPWAVGFGDGMKYLGSSFAWTTDTIGAECGFLEPSGNGLESLKAACEEKEAMMAALGARLIEPPKKDAEAYETVQLRASAETSTLARINLLTAEGLSEVMQWVEWWATPGAKDRKEFLNKAYVQLNADYVSARLTSEELSALVAARQQDLISWETFFFNMKRGEMYPEGVKPEEELKLIKATPAMPPISGLDADGNPIPGAPPPEPPAPPAAK